jgi:DNA-binding transcriptional ArsR family regulator
MPIYDDPTPPDGVVHRVAPSAALELFWVTIRCEGGGFHNQHPLFEAGDRRTAALAQRTQEFWGEGDEGFPELIVMASRRGLLLGESLDEFLSEIPLSALSTEGLDLVSETDETRAVIIERLERLRRDGGLRRRYLALLRELWRAVRSEWETVGLPEVRRACSVAERRLASGEAPDDLAPKVSEPSLRLLRERRRGEIDVCPGYFSGRCVWDLPGGLLLGIPAGGGGELAEIRNRAEGMAQRLKALADPTRLAIMMRLGRGSASITDITREFGISQPAVSVHFRVLRDADLVSGVRAGTRTLYNLDERRASDLLEELSGSLLVPTHAD